MMVSTDLGRVEVVLCPRRSFEGSQCQNEEVEFATGRLEGRVSVTEAILQDYEVELVVDEGWHGLI